MQIQKFVFTSILFALVLLGSVLAADKSAAQADINKLHEHVRTLDNELAVQREAFVRKLDDVEKRQGEITAQQANSFSAVAIQTNTFGNYFAVVALYITLLLAAGGLITYKSAKREAQQEARTAFKEWLDQNKKAFDSQLIVLNDAAEGAIAKINIAVEGVQKHAQNVHDDIRRAGNSVLSAATHPGESATSSADQKATSVVTEANKRLIDKDEAVFTGSDFYVRGLKQFSDKNYQAALNDFNLALERDPTSDLYGEFLFAKGMTLQNLSKSQEAIRIFLIIEKKYENEGSQPMLDLVNRALVKKALLYCKQGPSGHTDEMEAFDKLDRRLSTYRPQN